MSLLILLTINVSGRFSYLVSNVSLLLYHRNQLYIMNVCVSGVENIFASDVGDKFFASKTIFIHVDST